MLNTNLKELFTWEGFSSFFNVFLNDAIGNAVLCVACVLMLSYLRRVPPKFENKRIINAGIVLSAGAFVSRFLAHFISPQAAKEEIPLFRQAFSKFVLYMDINQLSIEDKKCIFFEILNSVIGIASICAGAFILMRIFEARHIVPMVVVQIFGFFLRIILEIPYKNFVNKVFLRDSFGNDIESFGYNVFIYGCFMIVMIIAYILITKQQYEVFWTKKTKIGLHFVSLIALFVLYTFLLVIYNYIEIFKYLYNLKELTASNDRIIKLVENIIKFLINVFFTFGLLIVPKLTYRLTCSELQDDFFEIKRKEEVEQYSNSEIQIKAQRKYMHDLPGHFGTLTSMAAKIGADEISQYISELDKKLIETKGEFSTGNAFLDDLLAKKLNEARKNNIDIVFNGVFPSEGINKVDITTIFHNLIENAIEACQKVSGKREIIISSTIHENRVYVTFSNPFEQKPQKKSGKFITTKKNKGFHGYGISSVKSTVKKNEYDGTFSTREDGNTFIAEINLKFKN